MANLIEPRILKGFRDFLPNQEIPRRDLFERIEAQFRLYGFVPIDTPVLEYAEILLGKGGGETEKQIYRFTDSGDRDVAMRFDLTVPFARFVAEHQHQLPLPFKRYHIAKVWRGENTQRGRYREFTQCDFDIVGSDSPAADFEILLIMRNTLQAIGAGDVTIQVNHRGLFNRFLQRLGCAEKSVEILRVVDKLDKIGRDGTEEALHEFCDAAKARSILEYIATTGSFEEALNAAEEAAGGPCPESQRLRLIWRFMSETDIGHSFAFAPAITRGLDYYTGIVYESYLNKLPEIGSVCSGGRYDNLAALYCRDTIPGVGASIGIDRLIAALESLGSIASQEGYAKAIIACIREEDSGAYQSLAGRLRAQGIPCEVFTEPKKLSQQFILAEKKGAAWVIIPRENPREDTFCLRDLASRKDRDPCTLEEAAAIIEGR